MNTIIPEDLDPAATYLLVPEGDERQCYKVRVDLIDLTLHGRTSVDLDDEDERPEPVDSDPPLQVKTRQTINSVCHARRLEHPDRILTEAAGLLAALWAAGHPFGMTEEDWRAVASLPGSCLDAAVRLDARRGNEPGPRRWPTR